VTIESLIGQYGLVALFLGAGLEGETVVMAGGVLAHQGLVWLPGAMAATAAGSFVADQLFFAAGRRFRDHRRVKAITAKPAFARAKAMLERHPTGFIVAFRFIYGIRTVSPIAIGTTDVPTRTFVILNAIAAVIWGILFSAIGYLFGNAVERVFDRLKPDRHTMIWIAAGIVALGLVLAAVHWWRGRRA